jgi:N-acetyl-1-D-myo-inositol-2-amino-2-deoxy-alpha-D-glucopyranoside deacetylase
VRVRLLAVHAHPDDETLTMGGTLARAVDAGAQVTLVTCTLGQLGEVVDPALEPLTRDGGDALGEHRRDELAVAMRALGLLDHRLLADGRWRDSGMRWVVPGLAGPADPTHPLAFTHAALDDAAGALADVVREVRPHVVLTYDPGGGYGHPDHVMAHRVTHRALELAGSDAVVLWSAVARSWARAERAAVLAAAADGSLPALLRAPEPDDGWPAAVVDDALLDVVVDVTAVRERRFAALRAHASQVRVLEPWTALTNDVAALPSPVEGFRVATGGRRPATPVDDVLALAGDG